MPEHENRKEKEERRAKSLDAEAQARGILPLTPLPEAPKYPCPYLSEEEITKYLSPLYEQGWRIGSSHFALSKHIAADAPQAPELAKEFMFAPEHSEAQIAFIGELEKLQSQENVSFVQPSATTGVSSTRPLLPASLRRVG